jgi:crotonobetainyl-CoA:carnitine CoA-transferase CaiB-like acyl-CoA transferase
VEQLKTRTAAEWFDKLNEAGVPNGPINTIKQGVEYAQKLGLEPVVQIGTGAKAVPGVRNPITFSATPARYDLAPPELGEHTEEIRAWLAAAAVPTASTLGES